MKTRLEALDLARGLALIGIIANHVFFTAHPAVFIALQDYHAILFMLLAGIVYTYAQGDSPQLKNRVRGIICIILGLALGAGNPPADIILLNYGWTFIIASFFVHKLSLKQLAYTAAGWMITAPIAGFIIRSVFGVRQGPNIGFQTLTTEPWLLFTNPILYSHYPVLEWFSVFLVGAALGRCKRLPEWLTIPAQSRKLLAVSGASFLVIKVLSVIIAYMMISRDWSNAVSINFQMGSGSITHDKPWYLLTSAPYTATWLGLTASIAASLTVIACCALIVSQAHLWLLQHMGSATLTLYSTHLLIHTIIKPDTANTYSIPYYLVTLAILATITLLWRSLIMTRGQKSPGPVEAITAMVVRTELDKRNNA